MSQNPYCILPWIHATSHTDGSTSPCCTWKSSAEKITYVKKHKDDFYAPFTRDSRQLISQLDRLRGDDLSVVNPEIYHQLQRNNQLDNP